MTPGTVSRWGHNRYFKSYEIRTVLGHFYNNPIFKKIHKLIISVVHIIFPVILQMAGHDKSFEELHRYIV